ncbi:hypothetical protein CPC08DRAFT_655083 [Agrocybe pediades]|nr:hypothetical protein CPC08DRAFT_655083 [Agrocybe pediades]
MPTFNITLENTSPMIHYSKNWRSGTSGDTSADLYSESSFTLCQAEGDSLLFEYYGTAVTVFGAHRGNHGTYQVTLDNGPAFTGNGSGSDAFMQNLYTGNGPLGPHTVSIMNQENTFFDVDYITFQTSVGQDGEDLIVNTYQDNHPTFVYTPDSSWSNSTDKLSWLSGSTAHSTSDPSAIATFTFEGDAIALYGPVGPSGGQFSVTVDNNSPSTYNANQQFFKPREILYYAGNLGNGTHTLRIQISSANLQTLVIDYADVYTTASLGGSFLVDKASPSNAFPSNASPTSASPDPSITVSQQSKSSTGLIAGLVVTSALALLATLGCMYLVWRLRRENKNSNPVLPFRPPTTSSAIPYTSFVGSSSIVTQYNVPPSAATGTTGHSYHASHNVPSSSGGASSAVSSTRAVVPSTSGYMPQGKRHVTNLSSGQVTESRRGSEAYPPQYTEGL